MRPPFQERPKSNGSRREEITNGPHAVSAEGPVRTDLGELGEMKQNRGAARGHLSWGNGLCTLLLSLTGLNRDPVLTKRPEFPELAVPLQEQAGAKNAWRTEGGISV